MVTKEKYLSNILQQLEDFAKSDSMMPNRDIENAAIKVYVRRSRRCVLRSSHKVLKCLDIAAISVRERYRRQGLFTDFMIGAHEINPFEMTYLECIHNPLIIDWCIKRGWSLDDKNGQDEIKDFYLLKPGIMTDVVVFTSLETSILSKAVEASLLTEEQAAESSAKENTEQIYTILRKLKKLSSDNNNYPGKVVLHQT